MKSYTKTRSTKDTNNKEQVLSFNDAKTHILKPVFRVQYYVTLAIITYLILGFLFIQALLAVTVAYLILVPIFLLGKNKEYRVTEFVIEKDKASYIRNWIDYNRNDIRYKNIKEVVVKQNAIKKIFNIGDICLISNISSDSAGITFFNIENPVEIYELIQERIDSSILNSR